MDHGGRKVAKVVDGGARRVGLYELHPCTVAVYLHVAVVVVRQPSRHLVEP
jgi:hypothetical protein